jgi:hypothetical protein
MARMIQSESTSAGKLSKAVGKPVLNKQVRVTVEVKTIVV